MRVENLVIRDFRNIREMSFRPDGHMNVLLGANGQGKTSVLEALGYLSTLQSFRGSKAPEVIRWGAERSEVACTLAVGASEDWRTELKVSFILTDPGQRKAKKLAYINDKPFHSSTQYLSQRFGQFELGFHAVVFNPSDHDLVRGDPGTRRSFLDRVLVAEDVEYLKAIQRYQRLLEQRNAILKNDVRSSRDVMFGFTEPLVQQAAILVLKRLEWIQRLSERLNDTVQRIAPKQPFLRLIYLSNWVPSIEGFSIPNGNLGAANFAGHGHLPSLELLEQAFWQRLSELEAAEWRAGHSLVGPHRDDWAFFFGEQVLKGHGSQGEVRSALLALKLSEIELFRNRTGHRPIFLLDDFSSELDRDRRSFLFRYLTETDLQVFVSTTEDPLFVLQGRRFWISAGSIREESDDERSQQLKGPLASQPES
jgi:DNA replication and repair protein RecF